MPTSLLTETKYLDRAILDVRLWPRLPSLKVGIGGLDYQTMQCRIVLWTSLTFELPTQDLYTALNAYVSLRLALTS